MQYKYEDNEIRSLEYYLNDNKIYNFIYDIINNRYSLIPLEFQNFQEFREFIKHIENIFLLAAKYGANNDIPEKLYFSTNKSSVIRYRSNFDDEDEISYMLNSFNLLSNIKTNDTNSMIYMDENFCSNREVPFINISELLGREDNLFLLVPFIDATYYDDTNCYEILPIIAQLENIDEVFYKVSDDEMNKAFDLLKQNSNDLDNKYLNRLTKLVRIYLQNYLINVYYKYMIEPKVAMIGRSLR